MTTPETEPGLSPEQLEAWISLIALLETLPAAIDGQLKSDGGINMFEYTMLAMLSEEADRTLPMSALAEVSFGSLSRLSHAVSRLERRGWVAKQVNPGRGPNTVLLTDDGLDAIEGLAGPHRAHIRQLVINPLTPDELATLGHICRKLIGVAAPDVSELLEARLPEIIERNVG